MGKTQRQPAHWVSSPPITGPDAAPRAPMALQVPSARARRAGSVKVVFSRDSVTGISSAAPPSP
nr:hypothetical protein [Streptomyces yatensis]